MFPFLVCFEQSRTQSSFILDNMLLAVEPKLEVNYFPLLFYTVCSFKNTLYIYHVEFGILGDILDLCVIII